MGYPLGKEKRLKTIRDAYGRALGGSHEVEKGNVLRYRGHEVKIEELGKVNVKDIRDSNPGEIFPRREGVMGRVSRKTEFVMKEERQTKTIG